MKFSIIPTPNFEKELKKLAKRHRSLKEDLISLLNNLKENPLIGTEITPGIRKIRMAITSKGKGKSGGARIITYTIVISQEEGEVYLMDIYDKSDYDAIDAKVIQAMIEKLDLVMIKK